MVLGSREPWSPLRGTPIGLRPGHHRMIQPGIGEPPRHQFHPSPAWCGLQTRLDHGLHRLGPITHSHDRRLRRCIGLLPQLYHQGRLGPERLPRGQLAWPTGQPGGMRQIGPRPAGDHIPHHEPGMGADRLGAIGAAGTRFMTRTRPPYRFTSAVPLGIIQGDGGIPAPAGGAFLFEHAHRLALDCCPVPGPILGEVFQHPPAGLQADGRQELGDGMFPSAQHHARDPLDKAHPAWPGEPRGQRGQQRHPPRPQWYGLIHDAPLLLAPLIGPSQPNRMSWGASWWVKILETTA
jgi:hypothetical protein